MASEMGSSMPAVMPMLAKLATTLPSGRAWRYEPKLDGFRGLLGPDCGGRVSLGRRNGKDLLRWFPELAQAGTALPDGTILQGLPVPIGLSQGRLWRPAFR